MVGVGVRGDQQLAVRERKIHLPHQLDDLVDRLFVANIDEHPVRSVEDQIHAATDAMPGLVVQLDHVREDRLPLEHG